MNISEHLVDMFDNFEIVFEILPHRINLKQSRRLVW